MLGGGQDSNKVKSTITQLMDMYSRVKDDRGRVVVEMGVLEMKEGS